MLSAHPHIAAYPLETGWLSPTATSKDVDLTREPRIGAFKLRLLTHIAIPPTARRWCQKTPRNVLFFPNLLQTMGENVRLIHIVRDGRDVVTSSHPDAPDRYWSSPARWVNEVGAGLRVRNHPQVFTLRYEDLVTHPELELPRLGAFLDEDFSDLHETWWDTATIRGARAWRGGVRELFDTSIGRWRAPEHEERVAALLAFPEARGLLSEFGYS
jgi:hypothetical protein